MNPVHIHDWHATILHLLGLDQEQLTYRYAGRDMRLTDVKGNVVTDVLAQLTHPQTAFRKILFVQCRLMAAKRRALKKVFAS